MKSDTTQVAIVGAGFAGLTAARELTKRGIDVRVLEARDRVGGRTWTVRKDGYWLDVGGQWTGPGQDRIRALGEEMGVKSFPTWPDGEHLQYTDGMGLRRWTGAAPTTDMETMSKVVQAIIAFDQLSAEVPVDAPWDAPHAREWDAMTVQGWIDQNIESERAREQMTTAIEAVFAAEPHDISLLHALFYAKSGLMMPNAVVKAALDGAKAGRGIVVPGLMNKATANLGRVLPRSAVRKIAGRMFKKD